MNILRKKYDSLNLSPIGVFLCSLLLVFPFVLTSHCQAGSRSVPVELTEYGSYNIYAAHAGEDMQETREASYYVKGYLYFKGQPLLAALTVSLGVSESTPPLKLGKLKELCHDNNPVYASTFSASTPYFLNVEDDGTMNTVGAACDFYELKAYLKTFTGDQAKASYESLSDEQKELVTAWRRGFQDAVRSQRRKFYKKFPELRATRILRALRKLNNQEIASVAVSWETLYDYGSLTRMAGDSSPYLSGLKLGEYLPGAGVPFQEEETTEEFSRLLNTPYQVKGIGASNSASVVYKGSDNQDYSSCMTSGQPHQPATEGFKLVPYCVQYKLDNNDIIPVLQFGYANTIFYTPMNGSKHIAGGGTADPIQTYEMFFARTNGKQYWDVNKNIWRNFKTKTFRVEEEDGSYRNVTKYTAEGYGDAYLLLRAPRDPGTHMVLLGRRRDANSAKTFLVEEKVAITGDADLFEKSLKENSAAFWGKSFCAPDKSGMGQTAALVNYQGEIHNMEGMDDFDPSYINPIKNKFLRKERLDNMACYGTSWASSDNGSIEGGVPHNECQKANNLPRPFDPGFQNSRQRNVQNFAEEIASGEGTASEEELLQFGTSTYSQYAYTLVAAIVYSINEFKDSIERKDRFLLSALARILTMYDGKHRGNVLDLFVYIMNEEYKKRVDSPKKIIPQEVVNFISGNGKLDPGAAIGAFNSEVAKEFQDILMTSFKLYYDNCFRKGTYSYRDAVQLVLDGQTLIEKGTWNGPSAQGGARNTAYTKLTMKSCTIDVRGVSPLSHIYMDGQHGKQLKIFQFMTSASKNSFVSDDIYETSVEAWTEVLKKHNEHGQGYAGPDAHIELCSFEKSFAPGEGPNIVKSFIVEVPEDLFNEGTQSEISPTAE